MMIPEVIALNGRSGVIRIPDQLDVPVTPRISRLIDSASFQRLSQISQLGLVASVYPGATHTRFEHSLGVYRIALLFVKRLIQFDEFTTNFEVAQIEALVVAALLHDIGHWPYCHPIEDLALNHIPKHEAVAAEAILSGEIAELLERDWSASTDLVVRLICGRPKNAAERLLCSILSGPIDVDKMDYLYRDSLHCGVPYGMNFDAPRLIQCIGINASGDGIAINAKGKTAAEMMVFSRYVMFSEVYWHRAVRSATAMLQRLFYRGFAEPTNDCERFIRSNDRNVVDLLRQESALFEGLFGSKRRLYKSVADFNADQNPQIFNALAHRPYDELLQFSRYIADQLSQRTGLSIDEDDILVDAPPPGLEVQFKVEVNDTQTNQSLESLSPVVEALAKRQFDHFVKKVRLFVRSDLIASIEPDNIKVVLNELMASGIANDGLE